jgi:hypothetical protein
LCLLLFDMTKEQLKTLLAYIDAKIDSAIAAHDPDLDNRDELANTSLARVALFESFGLVEAFPYSGMTYDFKTKIGRVIEHGAVVWEQKI